MLYFHIAPPLENKAHFLSLALPHNILAYLPTNLCCCVACIAICESTITIHEIFASFKHLYMYGIMFVQLELGVGGLAEGETVMD